ncbi:MAG: hypothetical protein JW731_10535 [Bacteroidales bacterium]|nr:hypothetical protein [Bacteroidales bacterium]
MIVFITGRVVGSNDIYDHSETNSYVVKYTPSMPNEREINNFFIKEIAKNNFTSLNNTRFSYHYAIHKSIQKVADYTYKVVAEITSEYFTGDIYYKGFDISDILLPEKADLIVKIIDSNNYYLVKDYLGIKRNQENKFLISFLFESYDEEADYVLVLDEISFYSEDYDKEAFQQRLSYIDEYYASLAYFDYGNQTLSKLSLTPKNIIPNYIRIKELERIYQYIAASDFIHNLDFSRYNNSDFRQKMEAFGTNLVQNFNNMEILVLSSEFIKMDVSYQTVARQYVDEVAGYFILSQDVTHSQSAFFFNYGKITYNQKLLNDYFAGLNNILLRSAYCNEIFTVTKKLEEQIFWAYLDKASEFIDDEQYFIAKGLLQNAQNFYQIYTDKSLPIDHHLYTSKANFGIYDSYLHLIDRAIDIGNYNLAENYIQKAKKFQQDNSTSIISDEYTTKLSEKLVRLYINKGKLLNESGEFEEAMYCFNQAQKICRELGRFNYDYEIKHGLISATNGTYSNLIASAFVKFENEDIASANELIYRAAIIRASYPSRVEHSFQADDLKAKVDAHSYQNYVSDGKTYLYTGNYYMAYKLFLQAFELEERTKFEIYDSLPYFFVQAATPYLVDQCKLGEVKVLKNQLDEAREIYDRCFLLQMEYGIDYDPRLQESLTLLNNSIFNKHCFLANSDFDKIISHFNNTIETGDFITALQVLNETNDIVAQNYYCEFDKALIVELRNKYSPAAEYQELANIAKEALITNDHEKFIETHKKMEELSSNFEVIRRMIEPMPLHYLFSIKKNLALLESAVKDYENKEEFETALKLLKVLQANNYSDRDTKTIQQNLACRMAYIDRQVANPNTDPKVNAENYTDGSDWYKYFKKSYVKNW